MRQSAIYLECLRVDSEGLTKDDGLMSTSSSYWRAKAMEQQMLKDASSVYGSSNWCTGGNGTPARCHRRHHINGDSSMMSLAWRSTPTSMQAYWQFTEEAAKTAEPSNGPPNIKWCKKG